MSRRIRSTLVGIGLATVSALALAPGTTASAVTTFPDVDPSSPFTDAIAWLAETGVSTGYDDGTFRPRNPITREAMAAYLYRLSGEPEFSPASPSPFPDVPEDSLFYTEVSWLSDSGITTGYPDGTFRPRNKVTREAMAAFLNRYAALTEPPGDSGPVPFLDVPQSNEFADAISWLAARGISTGWDAGSGCSTYRPKGAVTREAMAAFLYRFATGDDTTASPNGECSPPAPGSGSLSGNAGTVKVGSRIQPGTYRSAVPSSGSCYWERLSDASGDFDAILANDFVSGGQAIVTILPGDAYFHTDRCGTWSPIPHLGPLSARTSISGSSGTLLVGPDIRPGTYTSTNPGACYWERLSDFEGVLESIITNDFNTTAGASMVVQVMNADAGFHTSGCGTWRLTD